MAKSTTTLPAAQPADHAATRLRNIRRHSGRAKVLLAAVQEFVRDASDNTGSGENLELLAAAERVLGLVAGHLDSVHGLAAVRE